jgi:hypothetical protein
VGLNLGQRLPGREGVAIARLRRIARAGECLQQALSRFEEAVDELVGHVEGRSHDFS